MRRIIAVLAVVAVFAAASCAAQETPIIAAGDLQVGQQGWMISRQLFVDPDQNSWVSPDTPLYDERDQGRILLKKQADGFHAYVKFEKDDDYYPVTALDVDFAKLGYLPVVRLHVE